MSTTEGVDTTRENKGSFHFSVKDATVKDTDDGTKVTVPVSGLSEDRDGDKFTESGVEALVNQINESSIPMFPNHGLNSETSVHDYRFQDIMGRWESAERDGDVVTASATLRENDENAQALKDLLEQGMPVGFSIGFGWDESDAKERDTGGLEFNDADLMEVSPVGIPSNPDAVVQSGAEIATALKSAGVDPSKLDTDQLTKTLTESIKTTMSETETEASDDDVKESVDEESKEEEEEEEDKNLELDEETVSRIQNAVQSGVQAHAEAMVSDIMDGIVGATDEMDDEEEETEDYDEEEEEDKNSEVESLKSELEELKAELETVKTDAAESAGRKDGMVPAEQEETETEEKSVEASNTFEEALAFED